MGNIDLLSSEVGNEGKKVKKRCFISIISKDLEIDNLRDTRLVKQSLTRGPKDVEAPTTCVVCILSSLTPTLHLSFFSLVQAMWRP